jgi:hypothetical protein
LAVRSAVVTVLSLAALLLGGDGTALAASSPTPAAGARCVFWGEGHACQSTNPTVVLEVLNEHETSQCLFHESWSWGDGGSEQEVSLRGSIEGSTQLLGAHTYARPGTYKVSVNGYVAAEEQNLEYVCEAPPVEYTFTLLPGSSGQGQGQGQGGVLGTQESSTPPVVSDLSQAHSRWRSGTALARLAASSRHSSSPLGTVFSFDLSEQASVKLSFLREAVGRRVAGTCATATRSNRARPRCRLAVPSGTLSFTASPGSNRAYFQGRISASQALAPAVYELTVAATNAAGRRSAPRSLHFTLVK